MIHLESRSIEIMILLTACRRGLAASYSYLGRRASSSFSSGLASYPPLNLEQYSHPRIRTASSGMMGGSFGRTPPVLLFPTSRNTHAIRRRPRSTTPLASSSSSSHYPRAAVAVTVQFIPPSLSTTPLDSYYLLIQRGNPPNRGMWSLPGGKIQLGETTLAAGRRELVEETSLELQPPVPSSSSSSSHHYSYCRWHDTPFMTTDAIFYTTNTTMNTTSTNTATINNENEKSNENNTIAFHYLIAHCFAQIRGSRSGESSKTRDDKPATVAANSITLPPVLPQDDALAAHWYTLPEIRAGIATEADWISHGVVEVIERAEELSHKKAFHFI